LINELINQVVNPKVWFYSEMLIIATLVKQITAFQEHKKITKLQYGTHPDLYTLYVV